MKILLLENDFMLQDIINDYLISNDLNVVIAKNGDEVKKLLHTEQFDLLIFDISVPKINGINIAKSLRDDGFKKPLILISSSININDFKNTFKYGVDDFIRKPFMLEELLLKINRVKEKYLIESNNLLELTKPSKFYFY